MNNKSFDIQFQKRGNRNVYRAKVEITYKSENLLRLTISASGKVIEMEKHLYRKSNQWKLIKTNFNILSNSQNSAELILSIQNAIDYRLKELFDL